MNCTIISYTLISIYWENTENVQWNAFKWIWSSVHKYLKSHSKLFYGLWAMLGIFGLVDPFKNYDFPRLLSL